MRKNFRKNPTDAGGADPGEYLFDGQNMAMALRDDWSHLSLFEDETGTYVRLAVCENFW